MKKTMKLALLVCLALLACTLVFTACVGGNEPQTPNGTTDVTTDSHVHVFGEWMNAVAPTCTEEGSKARHCDCGEWETGKIPATGHKKGENGWCSACNQPYGTWVVNHYIDEFQKPTDETYITNVPFIGSFSNSATTNSLLKVDFIIDADSLALALNEYGDDLVKAYSNTEYEITVLDGSGAKHYYDGVMYKGGDRVFINDRQSLVSLMLDNSILEIHIKDDSSYPSTYLFTYIRDNFADIYNLDENAQ